LAFLLASKKVSLFYACLTGIKVSTEKAGIGGSIPSLATVSFSLPAIGLDRIGAGRPANGSPMVINITVPGAKASFEKGNRTRGRGESARRARRGHERDSRKFQSA
jgi:hypothetical protein